MKRLQCCAVVTLLMTILSVTEQAIAQPMPPLPTPKPRPAPPIPTPGGGSPSPRAGGCGGMQSPAGTSPLFGYRSPQAGSALSNIHYRLFFPPDSRPQHAAIAEIHNARQRTMYAQAKLRKLKNDAERFQIAERALQEGNIEQAVRLYRTVSLARNNAAHTLQARQRVDELREDGRRQLLVFEKRLARIVADLSESESTSRESAEAALETWQAQYRDFAIKYGEVPQLEKEISRFLEVQRRVNGRVLNEPEARRLLAEARALEESGEICCAFIAYEAAAVLEPAPSARQAVTRLDKLARDPNIVSSVQRCRTLQWCHDTFNEASDLERFEPEKAIRLYSRILERAPEDSNVYMETRRQLDALN